MTNCYHLIYGESVFEIHAQEAFDAFTAYVNAAMEMEGNDSQLLSVRQISNGMTVFEYPDECCIIRPLQGRRSVYEVAWCSFRA